MGGGVEIVRWEISPEGVAGVDDDMMDVGVRLRDSSDKFPTCGRSSNHSLCRARDGVMNSVAVRRRVQTLLGDDRLMPILGQNGGTFSLLASPSTTSKEVCTRFTVGVESGIWSCWSQGA